MRPDDNDLSGPAPRPASRVCARLASGEEAWARRRPRAAEPRAGGAARGTRFPCASPCVPASSLRSRVPGAGRGRRLSPPWPPARTCPRRPLAVPVPWGCRLWSSATPTWTARISGSACSVTRLSWSEPTSSSKSSLRTALCSSGRWGVSFPGGEWVERARRSGESPPPGCGSEGWVGGREASFVWMGLGTKAEELPCWWPTKFVRRCSWLIYSQVYREGKGFSLLDPGVYPEERCSKSSFCITLLEKCWGLLVFFVTSLCLVWTLKNKSP